MLSVADYASIQEAIDQNPGRMIFVPPGDYPISRAIRLTKPDSGLWGSGRIIQSDPKEAVVSLNGATRGQVRDLTLTRAAGKEDAKQSALLVAKSDDVTIAGVQVYNNWSDSASIEVDDSAHVVVRDCLVRDYYCLSVDDRTKTSFLGYAFNCINGTGINFRGVKGALIENNRVIETRLIATPEIKEKYQLGKIVKKTATKGELMPQEAWDTGYINIWRQGAGIHVGSGETSDCVQLIGNYIENTQQGMDVHCDHVIVSGNIVNDAGHGIKSMHGSRNILIVGNQFTKNDLFGVGLMQGTASHDAGFDNEGKPAKKGANIDGYSIIASNIISDFGYGMTEWVWGSGHKIGPAPIQLGGGALPSSPVLRGVLVDGNVIYNPGQDKILVNGKPQIDPPRYKYAVRVEAGKAAPRDLLFANNLFDAGTEAALTPNAPSSFTSGADKPSEK